MTKETRYYRQHLKKLRKRIKTYDKMFHEYGADSIDVDLIAELLEDNDNLRKKIKILLK